MIDHKKISYFIDKINTVASQSRANTKVGAILVDGESEVIVSSGYNKLPDLYDQEIIRYMTMEGKKKFVIHAEENLLEKIKPSLFKDKYMIVMVNFFPCSNCAKIILGHPYIKELYAPPIKAINNLWLDVQLESLDSLKEHLVVHFLEV